MKKLSPHRLRLTLALIALTAALPAQASANHPWGSNHWGQAAGSPTVRVDVGDNLVPTRSTNWPALLGGAAPGVGTVVHAWSNLHLYPLHAGNGFADVLETPRVPGANATSQKRCKPTSGRVELCNARYGSTGWLGLASIWTSGGHIVQGTAKVNDTYFDSAGYSTVNKQHVLCQEVGHTFGLGHTSEDGSDQQTCMDYDRAMDNAHPNAHDNEQIGAIYTNHADGTASTTTTSTSGSGKTRRLRDDLYVEEHPNGVKRFAFVTWVDRKAAKRAPNDRIPE